MDLKQNNKLLLEMKGGDNFNSFFDKIFFLPLSEKLVKPCGKFKITPNTITYLSIIFEFLCIYFYIKNKKLHAIVFHIVAYLLDCIDGKVAREFNLGSSYGMMLDIMSDLFTNFPLLIVILYKSIKNKKFMKYLFILVVWSIILNIMNGLVNILSFLDKDNKNIKENYVNYKENEVKDEIGFLKKSYIKYIKSEYNMHKKIFKNLNDKNKLKNYLNKIKQFGGGNFNILICLMLLNI
jgi:hypothetical protein